MKETYRRTLTESRVQSNPMIVAEPAFGFKKPRSKRIAVVLPEPLGPSKPKTSPAAHRDRQVGERLDRSVMLAQASGVDQIVAGKHVAKTGIKELSKGSANPDFLNDRSDYIQVAAVQPPVADRQGARISQTQPGENAGRPRLRRQLSARRSASASWSNFGSSVGTSGSSL